MTGTPVTEPTPSTPSTSTKTQTKTPTDQSVKQLSGLLPLLGGSEFYPDYKLKFKDPFISSLMKQEEFKGSLDPFLAKVSADDYAKMQIEDILRQQDLRQEPEMNNYFTYGVPVDIEDVFKTVAKSFNEPSSEDINAPSMMASGGLAAPLMAYGGATGGLPMVAHSGKARVDFRHGAAVSGPGDGQSDDIPAMLADGEFVFPADVVAALGNGSTKAGSEKLYDMMHSIRAHHRSTGPKDLPPQAKNPLDYLKKPSKARR